MWGICEDPYVICTSENSQWQVPAASFRYPNNKYLCHFANDRDNFWDLCPFSAVSAGKPFSAPDASFIHHLEIQKPFWQMHMLKTLPAPWHKCRICQECKFCNLSLDTNFLQHPKTYPEPTTTKLQTGATHWLGAVRNLSSPLTTSLGTSNLCPS